LSAYVTILHSMLRCKGYLVFEKNKLVFIIGKIGSLSSFLYFILIFMAQEPSVGQVLFIIEA